MEISAGTNEQLEIPAVRIAYSKETRRALNRHEEIVDIWNVRTAVAAQVSESNVIWVREYIFTIG